MRSRLASLFVTEHGRGTFDAWRAVLRWTDEHFGFSRTVRQLATDVRLALVWTHADRVFRILLGGGLHAAWIKEAFSDAECPLTHDFVFPNAAYTDDVAAPRHLNAESFALAALGVIGTSDAVASGLASELAQTLESASDSGRWRMILAMAVEEGGATNALGSWLDSNRRWLVLIPGALRETSTLEAVSVRVRDACAALRTKKDEAKHWTTLRVALGTSPPSRQTIDLLESFLLELDFSVYAKSELLLAAVAADVMGALSRYFEPSARRHLEAQLLAVASSLATTKLTDDERDAVSRAVLGGLMSCAWSEAPDSRAGTLARTLEDLEKRAPDVLHSNAAFVLRLCEILPPQAARHFWRVRELMRRRIRV
jgi:hypothetical protein